MSQTAWLNLFAGKDFADTENDINRVIKLCDKKDVSNKELDNEYANLTDEVRKITENEDIETKVPDKYAPYPSEDRNLL